METIRLRKTVERVRFDDEPGSKEYAIALDDVSLARMRDELADLEERLPKGSADLKADPAATADAMREAITVIAGAECYEDALAYVDPDGLGAARCNAAIFPLFAALYGVVERNLRVAVEARVDAYASADGTDAL